MLLKEMLNYRRGGNFDRIRAYGITLAYSNGMSRTVNLADNSKEDFYKMVYDSAKPRVNHFGKSKLPFRRGSNLLFR